MVPRNQGYCRVNRRSWACCCDMRASLLDGSGTCSRSLCYRVPSSLLGLLLVLPLSALLPAAEAEPAPAFRSPSSGSYWEVLWPEP